MTTIMFLKSVQVTGNLLTFDAVCMCHPCSSDEEEARDKVQEDDIKPKAPPAMRHIRRRDTFFDQKGPGQDYTSVIDTLSQSTEQDTRERQDFEPDTPSYVAKEPGTAPLTLRDEDEGRL